MLFEEIRYAVEAAPRERLPELSAALWKGFAAGAVTEAEAEELSLAIEARKVVGATGKPTGGVRKLGGSFPARKPQRPPQRNVAIERRRRLAASGPMPPALASRFTTGELAVLRIVADEVAVRGRCELHMDTIAARAGVSRTTAQNAIRQACRLGMLERQERRRTSARSLTNVLLVVDREWRQWLARGPKGGGFKNLSTTDKRGFREERGGTVEPYRRNISSRSQASSGR